MLIKHNTRLVNLGSNSWVKFRAMAVVGAVMVLGYVVTRSFAAGPTAAFEPETGTLSAGAVVQSISGASGTGVVRFGTGTTTSPTPTPTATPITCTTNATTSTFAGVVSAATAGQVVCLASGNYGEFTGVSKAITITKQSGASPVMSISFGNGDSGFTLDGLTIGGGDITGTSSNITIKNSAFTNLVYIESAAGHNLLLDHNTHVNINTCSSCVAGRVHVSGTGGTNSITIRNSLFDGGNSDGIRADADGVTIEGNTFTNILDQDPFHSDPIQIYGGTGVTIRGNLFIGGGGGPNGNVAAGIMMADGSSNNLVEYNVFTPGNHGEAMTWYHDSGSIIQHNTFVNDTIGLGSKSACGACTTIIRNNILAGIGNGGGGNNVGFTSTNNLFTSGSAQGTGSITGTPSYVGPVNTWLGYLLNTASPGRNAASDGKDMGINQY